LPSNAIVTFAQECKESRDKKAAWVEKLEEKAVTCERHQVFAAIKDGDEEGAPEAAAGAH
jgi:hypothetical protein